MAAPRKLPERDRLRTLLLSNVKVREIAATYRVSEAAVRQMISRENLTDAVTPALPSHKEFIPWRVKVAHLQDYAVRSLRLYARSLGLGAPLTNPELEAKARLGQLSVEEGVRLTALASLRAQLQGFMDKLDQLEVVVDYDREEGFVFVPRRSGDKHYVRWPKGVPDKRDEILARLRENST